MSKTTTPNAPADARERVITAAVQLYEEAGRDRFPTVAAVRSLSRVDMNTVSSVMKEWRQSQTMQAAPVAVAVPESIQRSASSTIAELWLSATELANQSLRSAQASWEKEREDLDGMRSELATSYEGQAAELESIKQQLADSEAKSADQVKQLAGARQSEAEAISRAERAEARAVDLREELDRALSEIDRQRTELTDARSKTDAAHTATEAARAELVRVQAQADAQAKQAAAEATKATERLAQIETDRDKIRAELATANATQKAADQETIRLNGRVTKAESDLDDARKLASAAREDAAKLTGTMEALKTQVAELMRVIAERKPSEPK